MTAGIKNFLRNFALRKKRNGDRGESIVKRFFSNRKNKGMFVC